jgi:DNA excision repair protein ERCC-4
MLMGARKRWPVQLIWHICMPKQVVADLRTLRTLGEHLLAFDAVTFLGYLEALRASESVNSVWLFHEAAHTIFEQVAPEQALHPTRT